MKSIKYKVCYCVALVFITSAFAHDFEPKYVGGYPAKETAERLDEAHGY